MARREFSRAVKVAVVKRCMRDGEVYCEQCGQITKGRFDIDHIRPDGLLGEPVIENARLLCKPCHREKTQADIKQIFKASRVEAAALGIRKKKRGFATSRKRESGDSLLNKTLTKVMPRRAMFEEIQ